MTPWRYVTHLFVLLLLIRLSKQEDDDSSCSATYFSLEALSHELSVVVEVVRTKDPKDLMECTLQRARRAGKDLSHILHHCFDSDIEMTESEKCKGNVSLEVSLHHLLCLVAKEKSVELDHKACDYDAVLQLYQETFSADLTTLSPTQPAAATAAPTTTGPSTTTTTTTRPPTTVTATMQSTTLRTTRPPTTVTTTTLQERKSTTPDLASTQGPSASPKADHESSIGNRAAETNSSILLPLSGSLNVILLLCLGLALYKCRQRRTGSENHTTSYLAGGQLVIDLEPNTLLISRSGSN